MDAPVQWINASNWPQVGHAYCAGNYPGEQASDWRQHYQPFACVFVSSNGKTIYACRDHFGQEPFYYSYQHRRFVFGSSIPAIIRNMPKHPARNVARILEELVPTQPKGPCYTNETYYEGIFRLEPGHFLTVENDKISSKPFWQIDPTADRIIYKDERDYVEHFGELLHEAVKVCVGSGQKLAAEFSGGLDSSAVVVACHLNSIAPALFSHVAPKNSEELDDLPNALALVNHLGLAPLKEVSAKDFNLIEILDRFSDEFAGAAPYAFFVLANNIHQAILQGGHKVLLSGFGGDECVSGHASSRAFFPQLIRECAFLAAWRELPAPVAFKFLKLLRYGFSPYKTMQHFEWDLLQGPRSHHLRMRIEYSAVVAKKMGFSYVYPLLYPKLVEFYSRLPWQQKRRGGVNRFLIRKYLAQHVPKTVWAKEKKNGGILPATLHLSKELYRQGKLDAIFGDLPFADTIQTVSDPTQKLLVKMDAYMFKRYWESAAL